MSALLARYGPAESRAATSLCLFGRGNGNGQLVRVRGGWWNGQQRRTASQWKDAYGHGKANDKFGLANEAKRTQEEHDAIETRKSEEREAHKKMSQFLRGKGWGLDSSEQKDANGRRSKDMILPLKYRESSPNDLSNSHRPEDMTEQPKGNILPFKNCDPSAEESDWSQSSEDAYWDAASKSVDEDQHQYVSARTAAPDEIGLGWSQQSEDAFWERTASLEKDITDSERESSERIFGSEVYGSAVPVRRKQSLKEQESGQPEPLPYINYEIWLPIAIEDGDADKVARCLYTAQNCLDYDFVNGISEATFTDILHVLEPRNNVENLSQAYSSVSHDMAKQMGLIPVNKLMVEYSLLLQEIVTQRRQSGHPLVADQYFILLRSAQDLGDSRLATRLLEEMQEDGVQPDVETYNAYLGSFVWAGWNNATARHAERVINVNMLARDQKRKDMPFANYHIGSPGGIKEKAMEILTVMLDRGLDANEKTYCSIITAAAREGEVDTVQSILRTAWDIDVQKIMELTPGHADLPRAKALPIDSEQYPTSKLLWTLAHAFCINNDIPKALRLIDYVSREYDLAISEETWSVLLEWTFVMARRRHGTAARDDRKTGQLPQASVQTLFNTMTTAPYFVQPTMGMYNHLVVSMYLREWTTKMLEIMEHAMSLKAESKDARDAAWSHLRCFLTQQEKGQRYLPPPSVVRRRYQTAKVIDSRNSLWMKRWVRLFFASMEHFHRRHKAGRTYANFHAFTFGTVPRMLLEWREFAGARVKYDLPTGVLEIELQSEEEKLRKAVLREKIWYAREEATAKTGLLVGHGLLDSYESPVGEGEVAGATTRRLKKARQRAVDDGSLADRQWLAWEGAAGLADKPHTPSSSSVLYQPPRF
jgi:hypothetical protein